MSKKPKKVLAHSGQKVKPHGSKNVSDEDRKPKFSLRLLQKSRCISDCTDEEKAALVNKMHKLSQIPWREIRKSGHHNSGYEKIRQHSLKVSIPEEAKPHNIIAMRFYGMAAMLGYRVQATFYLLWLDRDFNTYKH